MRLKKALELEFDGVPPYSFELTVKKPAGWKWLTPFEEFSKGTVWTGMRVFDRPIGVKAWSVGTVEKPRVTAEVHSTWKMSNEEERAVEEKLLTCLRLKEDIADFYKLAERHEVLRRVRDDLYGMRDTPFPDVFSGSILAVTLQMTSIKRSEKMREALYREFGERLVFDGRRVIVSPSPKKIAALDADELRGRCNLGYRAAVIKGVADTVAARNAPTMEDLIKMTPEEGKKELMRLKGIGDYSADIISPYRGFPVDVWSARIFAKIFGMEVEGDVRKIIPEIKRRAEDQFGEWRGYVFVYILNDLERLHQMSP